jgi:orotate phosphoribosyltransferase
MPANLNPLQTAQALLDYKILELSPASPFTFASGIKSPIYCDGRRTISYHELRKNIAYSLAQKIKAEYPDVEVISGVATGSIAMAAWVAEILELPMIYWRKPKGHGLDKTVEGVFTAGQKVVVIEDTVSTGGSCLTAVESIKNNGLEVLGVAFIYSHQMQKSIDNFTNLNCKFVNLCGLSDVLEYAQTSGSLTPEQVEIVKDWKSDPAGWGARHGFVN